MALYYLTNGIIDAKYIIIGTTTDIEDVFTDAVFNYGESVKCIYYNTESYKKIYNDIANHFSNSRDSLNNNIFQITDASLSGFILEKYKLISGIKIAEFTETSSHDTDDDADDA